MTTTVVNSIGSGKTYSTVAAWIAAVPADLTSVDEIWKGEVYDELTVTGTTTMSGTTTDATRYMWLAAAAASSLCDDASQVLRYTTGKAGMTGNVGSSGYPNVLLIGQGYSLVERLQFRSTSGASSTAVKINAPGVVFRNNLVDNNAISACVRIESTSGTGAKIIQNVLIYRGASGGEGVHTASSDAQTVIANTIVNLGSGTNGIACGAGYNTINAQDNAIFGAWSGGAMVNGGSGFGASDYNAMDDTSALGSGAHQLTSKTFSAQFRNITSGTLDLRAATSGSDIAGAGTRQNTYTSDLDFFGQARSTSAPTIGAYELAAAAGSSAKRLLMLGAG